MSLRFPVDCDSPRRRVEYCYRAQELLRLIHNGMGKWYREGLTQQQWNRFPQRLKNHYPYKAHLSKVEWDDFLIHVFTVIENKIVVPLCENRALLFQSTEWSINIGDLVD